MNVWSKLLTALRGGANEMGEAMVDSQALRILDQEIRDADLELRKSKEALAEIMAKQKLAADRADRAGELRLHVRIDERVAGFTALGLAKASGRPVAVITTR